MDFSGKKYWLSKNIFDRIKKVIKKVSSENLTFSFREFTDPEAIQDLEITYDLTPINHLKNTTDDIYFICSKNTKNNYEKIIKKIEKKLEKIGLFVKKYYFISDTFYNRDLDDVAHKKTRLLLQHLVLIDE